MLIVFGGSAGSSFGSVIGLIGSTDVFTGVSAGAGRPIGVDDGGGCCVTCC